MIIKTVNKIAHRFGYKIKVERTSFPFDILGDKKFMHFYNQCKEYTMTSLERMYGLYQSVNYVIDNKIEGDFVECGVWRGGSSMMMALMLKERGESNRKLFLYDTFEGMSAPTEHDKTAKGSIHASAYLKKEKKKEHERSVWCYASIEDVQQNLQSTGYPQQNLFFIQGKVEDTLAHTVPGQLALLRLDTDWYESTRVELEVLYPLLVQKGILIIDDFGHWEGAKKAVVEYFDTNKTKPLFQRIDYTARMVIKQ
jgi:O-methyltransferase